MSIRTATGSARIALASSKRRGFGCSGKGFGLLAIRSLAKESPFPRSWPAGVGTADRRVVLIPSPGDQWGWPAHPVGAEHYMGGDDPVEWVVSWD